MRFARATFIPLAIAGLLPACHKQTPPPNIDSLSAALEHDAEKTLAVPSLANEQVILTAGSGRIDAVAAEVVQAASSAGGAALRSTEAQGRLSILATIPDNNADAFKAAIHHAKVAMAPPSSHTSLIEVLIENPAPASPTP
ncbi:MAG: hypothetical protein ABSE62_13565 [Chthoniobacteraceae bacterium]|jgi:hypothetical protein